MKDNMELIGDTWLFICLKKPPHYPFMQGDHPPSRDFALHLLKINEFHCLAEKKPPFQLLLRASLLCYLRSSFTP